LEQQVVLTPSVTNMSFMASGTPVSGAMSMPSASLLSAARAAAIASSAQTVTKALMAGSRDSISRR